MPKLHYDKTRQITPSNAQTALVDLSLNAVALCNEGSNSRADILLVKSRKEGVNMPKTFEELLKALQPEQADIVTKHIAGVEAAKDEVIKGLNGQVTELTSQVTNLTGQVDSLQKSKPTEQEDVLKSLSPELQAMFKKQQETIDGLLAAQAEDLAKSRFEKCKAIPCEEAELKDVLKSASPAVVAILEKAAAAIEKGAHSAVGADGEPAFVGTSAEDLYGKLEKSARELMAGNEGMTFEKAFTKACEADPATYQKYVKGAK